MRAELESERDYWRNRSEFWQKRVHELEAHITLHAERGVQPARTVTIRRAYETEGGRFVIRVRLKEQTGHREDVELPAVPRVGDLIHRPSGPELKVVSVHWSVDPEVSADVVLLVVPSTTEDYR